MYLNPRPPRPEDHSFQDEARLMAYLHEVASEREAGPRKRQAIEEEEERARAVFHRARFRFIPDPNQSYEVVCKRMDWYHGLYQLAGEEHVRHYQVSSWDPEWERMPFPGCHLDQEFEPLFGDHSPYPKEAFSPYRKVHFGLIFRERIYAFRSRQFMEAVHAYYAQEDWMWRNNEDGKGIEAFIWSRYYDPNRHLDQLWPFDAEEGDAYFGLSGPRWYANGGRLLTWCTHSSGHYLQDSSSVEYGFRKLESAFTASDVPPF